jgi:hypothetical protein
MGSAPVAPSAGKAEKGKDKAAPAPKKSSKAAEWKTWAYKARTKDSLEAQSKQQGYRKREIFNAERANRWRELNKRYGVRRFPFLDLRNFELFSHNPLFKAVTGAASASEAKSAKAKQEQGQEGEDDKQSAAGDLEDGEAGKKGKKKKGFTPRYASQGDMWVLGMRLRFVEKVDLQNGKRHIDASDLRATIVRYDPENGKHLLSNTAENYEEWVDLSTKHVLQYSETVWAKVSPYIPHNAHSYITRTHAVPTLDINANCYHAGPRAPVLAWGSLPRGELRCAGAQERQSLAGRGLLRHRRHQPLLDGRSNRGI